MLIEETLAGFLDDVASSSPAPGGGSVSALSGALGAGLGAMVCRLTVGKEKYKAVQEDMTRLMIELDESKKRLMLLIDMDSEAFNKLMLVFKLPKGTDGERVLRKEAIQEATKEAISVPMETCMVCLQVVETLVGVAEKGNTNSITDAGCAVLLARAGFQGAAYNVRINLRGLKDHAFKDNVEKEFERMSGEIEVFSKKALEHVSSKL